MPDAATDSEEFREIEIDVPRWFNARIRFERFHFKRGKNGPIVLDCGRARRGPSEAIPPAGASRHCRVHAMV